MQKGNLRIVGMNRLWVHSLIGLCVGLSGSSAIYLFDIQGDFRQLFVFLAVGAVIGFAVAIGRLVLRRS